MARILVYNPGHEEALVVPLHQAYSPPTIVRRMMADLWPLMQYQMLPGDLVMAPSFRPTLGPFALYDHTGKPAEALSHHTYTLELWAPEPHTARLVAALLRSRGIDVELPTYPADLPLWSHRRQAALCLQSIGAPAAIIPMWCSTLAQIEAQLHAHGGPMLAKCPYTSSGRGLIALDAPLTPAQRKRLTQALTCYGSISVEPYLSVVENWAVEYYADGQGGMQDVALSHFLTRADGAYIGNLIAPDEQLRERFAALCRACGQDATALFHAHQNWLLANMPHYPGYIGVDMFFYRTSTNQMQLHPCVEINLRQTMGLMAHQLSLATDLSDTWYRFSLLFGSGRRPLTSLIPTISHKPGYRALTPIAPDTAVHAYLQPIASLW